jgi:hypothetical protein
VAWTSRWHIARSLPNDQGANTVDELAAAPTNSEGLRAQAEAFLSSASRIIENARSRHITLRLLGSLAYRLHCPNYVSLLDEMLRVLTDLDFASERRFARQLQAMFVDLGYQQDSDMAMATGGARQYYKHPGTGLGVDIFMDKLDFCHPISFDGRLEIDSETIPLAELLLEKMQIVELNVKDVKDTIVLLLEHPVGTGDTETVNVDHIARILAADWGFHHTVTTNLNKVAEHVSDYEQVDGAEREVVLSRIDALLKRLESEPKSLGWKARARIGTRVRWYQQVEAKP